MGGMRSEVCTGLFRSSTNLAAFENMLSSLSGVAKTTGPESGNAGFDNFKGGPGRSRCCTAGIGSPANRHSSSQRGSEGWTQ